MVATLEDKLSGLGEALKGAKSASDLNDVLVDVSRINLKRNYDAASSGQTEEYIARDYLLGEANTRGLSWKLVLMASLCKANFCFMQRIGIHGGTIKIIGQPSNVDTVIHVFEDVTGVYDGIGAAEYTRYSEGHQEEDGPLAHKAGWINQFLSTAPLDLTKAVDASREADTASNAKLAKVIEEKGQELSTYRSTLGPAKAVRTPKAPKEPKDPNAVKPKKGKKPSASATVEAIDTAPAIEADTETDTASETTDLGPAGQ